MRLARAEIFAPSEIVAVHGPSEGTQHLFGWVVAI
jgi:hypothetical protein